MILLEDRQLVILTPPHTASGNLHRALCGPWFGGRWVIGPTPDESGFDHHVMTVAEGWRSFRVAVVVRHPLERLIGLYEHHQHTAQLQGWEPIAWWQFVAMVLERNTDLSWFYRSTISELLDRSKTQPRVVLKYETLNESLAELLGEPVDLPTDRTDDRNYDEYFHQCGVCLMAEHWGSADIERFGYVSQFAEQ